jgi:hypothetical protein
MAICSQLFEFREQEQLCGTELWEQIVAAQLVTVKKKGA